MYTATPWVPPSNPKLWPPDPPLSGDQIADYAPQSLINAKQWCQYFNDALYARYVLEVNNYDFSVDAGRPAPGPVPTVPMAYLPVGPDVNGYFSYGISTYPLCAALAVDPDQSKPAAPVPGTIVIGNLIPDTTDWFQALDGDTFAPGLTTPPMTSADGVSGRFQKYRWGFGNGAYLKVS